MPDHDAIPELKRLIGGLVFAANRPINAKDIRKCLQEVAEFEGEDTRVFADAREQDIEAAIEELRRDVEKAHVGFHLMDVAGGLRYQSDPACGRWVRHLLSAGKPARLSLPALETLAIIAYRQPIGRSDIEQIRGVNVDYIIKMLLEAQLIRITGRSELPGRPFLYGTTQAFLEHFGLKSLKDLGDMEPFLAAARDQERAREAKAEAEAVFDRQATPGGAPPAEGTTASSENPAAETETAPPAEGGPEAGDAPANPPAEPGEQP